MPAETIPAKHHLVTQHRFYVPTLSDVSGAGDCVDLNDDESVHVLRVLRLKVGDSLVVFGNGVARSAVVERAGKGSAVTVRLDEPIHVPPPASVRMSFVLPWLRGGRTEFLFQKLTELGAEHFVVYDAARQTAKGDAQKLERLERVVQEAAKQCERADVPTVVLAGNLVEGLRGAGAQLSVVLAERSQAGRLSDVVRAHQENAQRGERPSVAFAIGPEGGLTPEELEECAAFCQFATLGARILRADTAPLVAAAVALSAFGDL